MKETPNIVRLFDAIAENNISEFKSALALCSSNEINLLRKLSDRKYMPTFMIYDLKDSSVNALHYAMFYGRTDMVRSLLNAGALVNTCDSVGFTPIHYATFCLSEPSLVDMLLNAGADLSIKANGGLTAIDRAKSSFDHYKDSESGDLQLVKYKMPKIIRALEFAENHPLLNKLYCFLSVNRKAAGICLAFCSAVAVCAYALLSRNSESVISISSAVMNSVLSSQKTVSFGA